MHCFSRKRRNVCKITLSTWTPAWGLEGLFRSPRAKLYFTALFPLAWVVGKTNWYFHSESNCLKNNVSSYCSQSARNRNTWSSKLFGWPCQLSNIQSSKQKHVGQDIRKENQTHTCTFMCSCDTIALFFSKQAKCLILIMQTTWPYAQECFRCGSWAWKQYTEKGKSSCFISAIYTVKCWNPPGLLYDLENHFAALAVVWEVCK